VQCIFVDLPNWIEALAALGLVAITYLNRHERRRLDGLCVQKMAYGKIGTENCRQRTAPRRKVSRVSLVLAHDSTRARTNTGAEPRVSRAFTSVSC